MARMSDSTLRCVFLYIFSTYVFARMLADLSTYNNQGIRAVTHNSIRHPPIHSEPPISPVISDSTTCPDSCGCVFLYIFCACAVRCVSVYLLRTCCVLRISIYLMHLFCVFLYLLRVCVVLEVQRKTLSCILRITSTATF